MAIKIEPLKCQACHACELGCTFYRDQTFSTLWSSIIMVMTEEQKNYYGVVLKKVRTVALGCPEGYEEMTLSDMQSTGGEWAAAVKPIVLRSPCDECDDPLCVRFCPTGAIAKA
jgi:Fe-S-cluster-containing dehydrogenase component